MIELLWDVRREVLHIIDQRGVLLPLLWDCYNPPEMSLRSVETRELVVYKSLVFDSLRTFLGSSGTLVSGISHEAHVQEGSVTISVKWLIGWLASKSVSFVIAGTQVEWQQLRGHQWIKVNSYLPLEEMGVEHKTVAMSHCDDEDQAWQDQG